MSLRETACPKRQGGRRCNGRKMACDVVVRAGPGRRRCRGSRAAGRARARGRAATRGRRAARGRAGMRARASAPARAGAAAPASPGAPAARSPGARARCRARRLQRQLFGGEQSPNDEAAHILNKDLRLGKGLSSGLAHANLGSEKQMQQMGMNTGQIDDVAANFSGVSSDPNQFRDALTIADKYKVSGKSLPEMLAPSATHRARRERRLEPLRAGRGSAIPGRDERRARSR